MSVDLFVHQSKGLFTKVNSQVVILVEASGGCSRIITREGNYLVSSTLSQLEKKLPVALFCRVHRSYIVALEQITSVTDSSVKVLDRDIPLSRAYAPMLFSRIRIIM
ncbi:LytTR family DNA-binding domain-containing protein [Chitinophaga sp. LS1]|uniref:LytR/AlgR family response regulator transcription factor n=1 Tax=Chitinophaga sp. LS1 TaxID=3051176 RepID=UPI002AAB0FC3|nr:LytTR family DNA-binding domain-containing protein [Chitinophaga sp. LS1]WPV67833.1 LytTR family DNA-binding domain-containing protein [Chitinophaga sp. LS1]